jgi:glycerate 2-kinase
VRPDDPRLDRVENVIVAAPSQSLRAAADLARRRATTSRCWATRSRARHGTSRVRMPSSGARGQGAARDLVGRRTDGDAARRRHRRSERGIRAGAGRGAGWRARHPRHRLRHRRRRRRGGGRGRADRARYAGQGARRGARRPPRAVRLNDAHSFFEKIGGQVVTGPTLTNVNDFRAILIAPPT